MQCSLSVNILDSCAYGLGLNFTRVTIFIIVCNYKCIIRYYYYYYYYRLVLLWLLLSLFVGRNVLLIYRSKQNISDIRPYLKFLHRGHVLILDLQTSFHS
jgi:hypothetical protein